MVGITPARAGKSSNPKSASCVNRDHPRACGEKVSNLDFCSDQIGSPPRVRGKGRIMPADIKHHGITPARAGKRKEGKP